jgi:hypothetical protein
MSLADEVLNQLERETDSDCRAWQTQRATCAPAMNNAATNEVRKSTLAESAGKK